MISVEVEEKRHRRMEQSLSSGSSDALGFGHCTSRSQIDSAPDEPVVKAVIHPCQGVRPGQIRKGATQAFVG
jgi:hypothetical protein